LTSLTDPLERTWTYGYDAYGNRVSEADPLGYEQTTAYDGDSRAIAITTPRGNLEGAEPTLYTTAVERDAQGRPLKVTDPLGQTAKYAYDGNGNLASLTDAKGHTTKDPLMILTHTAYGYANENPLSYNDPSGMACIGVGRGLGGAAIFPTFSPGDCAKEAAGAAGNAASTAADHASLAIAPVVFLICVYEPEACSKAALLGAAGTAATEGAKKLLNPCFDLKSALLQDLLVTLAAALPGGLFEITAARLGPELGPVARRAIQALLDAPGLGAEEVHAARGG